MKASKLHQICIRNLRGRRSRTVLIMICVALITSLLFSETILFQGVERSLDSGIGRLGADVLVVPGEEQIPFQTTLATGLSTGFYMDSEKEREIADVEGVKQTSSQLFLASLSDTPYSAYEIQLVAFDPETDFTVTPWMKEALNRPLGKDEVIVGNDISNQVGEMLIFYGHRFIIAGRLDPTGTGLDRLVFMSFEDAYVMAEESIIPSRSASLVKQRELVLKPNTISAVLVKVEEGVFADIVSSRIRRLVGGVTAVSAGQLNISIGQQLSGVLESMLFVTAVLWVASVLLVGTVFWMAVNERRREIGLLRAIGATKSFVFKMIIVEALLLTFLGGVLGVVGGGVAMYSFSLLISKSLNIPYLSPTFTQIVRMTGISLAIAVLTGLVASFVPALVSSRMEPLKAIRVGE